MTKRVGGLQDIEKQREIVQAAVVHPERCMAFLRPGRLVTVRVGDQDWGTGVIVAVSVFKLPGGKPGAANQPAAASYLVDTLLQCAPGSAPGELSPPRNPHKTQEWILLCLCSL